ncbi:MAG: tetratricopeptide repeat protein [Pyrinomonadaceae bacterium]|nr:tetratricopeptide repeat protein [Pyrinomonadaceae bacterium]
MLDGTEIIHLERAEHLIGIARWRQAIHELHKYLTYFPEDYNALCQISRCHYELKETEQAMKFAKQAIKSNPENEWAYRLKSLIHRENGENNEALTTAEICVQKAPQLDFSLQTLAYAQIRKFKFKEAEKTVNAMLEVAPNSAETHEAVGYLALKKEQWGKAESHYLKALSINALSANSLNNLGVVYLNQVDKSWKNKDKKELKTKAIDCFERAIKTNPTYQLAHDNLKLAKSKSTLSTGAVFLFVILGIFLQAVLRSGLSKIEPFFNNFTPKNPGILVNILNIYFILVFIFTILSGFYFFPQNNREKLWRILSNSRIITFLFLSQFLPFLLYIFAFIALPNSLDSFSITAFCLFLAGTLVTANKMIKTFR